MTASISLSTTLTPEGVICANDVLGKVATIVREVTLISGGGKEWEWTVRPYAFPIYERGASFQSYAAAEFYSLALAHEMLERRKA